MRKTVSLVAAILLLVVGSALYADNKPHEGKITTVDTASKRLVVQGEKGDQWELYWTDTTKLKNNLIVEDLKVGDSVHFDYIDKDGQKLLTELNRTKMAPKN